MYKDWNFLSYSLDLVTFLPLYYTRTRKGVGNFDATLARLYTFFWLF